MKTVAHAITLASTQHFSGKVPPHHYGLFLAELPLAVRGAVAMALQNRSYSKGRRPEWLRRASDIRFAGHQGNGETTLFFEAPLLGEAAEELYRQGELFPTRPDANDTAINVLEDVLLDVEHKNADSERFDHPLLKRLVRFGKVFDGPFFEARFGGECERAKPARLSPSVIQTARRLYDETPNPRRVRLVGTLDMVRASNRTFALRLEDGQEARGSLVEGSVEGMAALLNQPVLVFGTAIFRPSGRFLRVDADEYRRAADTDMFFAKMPKPLGKAKHRLGVQERRKMADGLKAVFGRWPGDETDEQIQSALKELG